MSSAAADETWGTHGRADGCGREADPSPGSPHRRLVLSTGPRRADSQDDNSSTRCLVRGSKIAPNLLLLSKRRHAIIPVGNLKVSLPMKEKPDVLQGTLALMVLKTLDVLGPQHGYGIARRIEQIRRDILAVNQGTLYPLLLKLEHEGSIASQWGASENNRRARFYRLTATGRKQLQAEARDWKQTAAIIARFFEVKAEDLP